MLITSIMVPGVSILTRILGSEPDFGANPGELGWRVLFWGMSKLQVPTRRVGGTNASWKLALLQNGGCAAIPPWGAKQLLAYPEPTVV